MTTRILKYALVPVLAVGLLSVLLPGQPGDDPPVVGNVDNLKQAYDKWKTTITRAGGDRTLTLALGYEKGLSVKFTPANGRATIDLVDGRVSVQGTGLPEREVFDVWLVDNRPGPGRSVKPEVGDRMLRLGRLTPDENRATLETRLEPETFSGFELDLVVVAAADETPATGGALFGSPSLFQRLFYAEHRRGDVAPRQRATETRVSAVPVPFRALVPSPAYAQEIVDAPAGLEDLVAEGERLFFNETFDGNGRTCGTCHPAENNFTIDPAFIARLAKQRPRDPLFVAELDPALHDLEKPELMRKFGLILENADGFDRPGVMRGVPHTLGLAKSLTQPTNLPGAPPEMTGWSGDGSPGGTLLDFATGAVIQHFTKTLNRVEGVDFRRPTDAELLAMEAFQLSLGRQDDLDLATLVLRNPVAKDGQNIFENGTGDPDAPGTCSACHGNAGALNADGENRNFDTGAEDRPDSPSVAIAGVPRDGGFGKTENSPGVFGDGRFNTPPLVESADTGPFFHNNVVNTIEQAIEHYNSLAFNNVAFAKIQLGPEQVEAVAAFLRITNAVENDRSATAYAIVAMRVNRAQRPLTLAIKDIADAIRVLTQKKLEPDAVDDLRRARLLLELARRINRVGPRNFLIESAIHSLQDARANMVESG